MRLYDIVVVLAPEQSGEEIAAALDGFKKILVDGGANIVNSEEWGRRRLAYSIGKRREGVYQYWQAESSPETVAELERKLKLSDGILRHLVVRIDDEIRRSTKLKKKREEKAARRPKKTPVEPAAQASAEPGA
jgi:small subunit ribosomal protein S6